MFRRYVPGHIRANTLPVSVALAALALFITRGNLSFAGGIVLIVAGLFLSDQATHLAQANHADQVVTPIERLMQGQNERWLFVITGWLLAAVGVLVLAF